MKTWNAARHQFELREHLEWEWNLGQVTRFIREHGHDDLGAHPAGEWLARQRALASTGRLSVPRRRSMEAAGISLAAPEGVSRMGADQAWEAFFQRLDDWQAAHGHCRVPERWKDDPALAEWVREQRRLYHGRGLAPEKILRLDALGFEWRRRFAPKDELWNRRYQELAAWQRKYGHTNVTRSQNSVLGHWRDVQREFRKKGVLRAERIALLDEIGFEWTAPGREGMTREEWNQHTWEEHFGRLRAFKERFGHCQVPVLWEEDRQLAGWAAEQRNRRKRGKLPEERLRLLDELGFVWKPHAQSKLPPFSGPPPRRWMEDLWNKRYAEMKEWHKLHGHTRVTESQNAVLAKWREVQRRFRRSGKLRAERVALLEQIGFEWESPRSVALPVTETSVSHEGKNELVWRQWLEKLAAFKERHGHTQVPKHWPEDPKLAGWVAGQRKSWSRGALKPERRQALDDLGFEWKPAGRPMRIRRAPPKPAVQWEKLWEQRFGELKKFHQSHGHCRVPSHSEECSALSSWCYTQRALAGKNQLRPDRKARLDALGFRWDATDAPGLSYEEKLEQDWQHAFARLRAFKERHGHSRVPAKSKNDPQLGSWCERQRQRARQGGLKAEHRRLLESLDFEWNPGNEPVLGPRPDQRGPKPAHERVWQRHLQEYLEWARQHGSPRTPPTKHSKLGRWCAIQRRNHLQGRLTPGRRARLEAAGFPFEVTRHGP